MLHGHLERRLRGGGSVGHRQLLTEKIVRQGQPARFRRLPFRRGHLTGQQQLPGAEPLKQLLHGHLSTSPVQDPGPAAQRQRQDDHIRCRSKLQVSFFSVHLPGLDPAPLFPQQGCQLCLAPVPSNDPVCPLQRRSPLSPWYAEVRRR